MSELNVVSDYNNAVSFLNLANKYLQENQVYDSRGNVASFSMLASSPAWLFALAEGSIASEWQRKLLYAVNQMNISACSDEQVLVLANLAGITRKQGSSSSVTCILRNTGDISLTLRAGTLFTENVTDNQWGTTEDITIAPMGFYVATLYSVALGAFSVPAGTDFTPPSVYTTSIVCSSQADSVMGDGIETITQMRNRISSPSIRRDPVTSCESAIAQLSGVRKCTIWFNPSVTANLDLVGGVSVPPRTSYVIIQGRDFNDLLPLTYFSYINAPTLQTDRSVHSVYKRGAAEIDVYYDTFVTQECYVRIHVAQSNITDGYNEFINALVVSNSADMGIGKSLSSSTVISWIEDNGYATVTGAELSLDGVTYSHVIVPNANAILSVPSSNITVEVDA